jgi:hypothetical protein
MKSIIREILFGKSVGISGLIALAIFSLVALGCTCGKYFDLSNQSNSSSTSNTTSNSSTTSSSDSSVPSDSEVESMVKATMSDFADAVSSGNFSDLYNKASSDFRSTYTLDEVNTAFKTYVDKKSFVVPLLRKTQSADADFTTKPSIRTEKGLDILVATGKFPTKPYNVRFDYEYVKRGGEWKLLKLVTNIP